jgi:hypothetical protein
MGGLAPREPPGDAQPVPGGTSWRERLGALRNLPPFLKLDDLRQWIASRLKRHREQQAEAMGTHAEPLAQHGRCAELFELQAAGYR